MAMTRGRRLQRRLFADREGAVPAADDVIELRLSSLRVREPRRFGDCWAGCRLWQELGLDAFWQKRLENERGEVPWAKVLELLAVNRLLNPRSELLVHEKWFPQTAMDVLLDCDFAVAHKDRLYRCLDRIVEHKAELEQHLAAKWKDLFGGVCRQPDVISIKRRAKYNCTPAHRQCIACGCSLKLV